MIGATLEDPAEVTMQNENTRICVSEYFWDCDPVCRLRDVRNIRKPGTRYMGGVTTAHKQYLE